MTPNFERTHPISIEDLENRASSIRMLLLDVDGILTDGLLYLSNSGDEYKTFNTLDGQGIRIAISKQLQIGIITGRKSKIVSSRAAELGIKIVKQGCLDKESALADISHETGIPYAEIAYAGDDVPDLPVLKKVGLSITVPRGHASAKAVSHTITSESGGAGAVREMIDFILSKRE